MLRLESKILTIRNIIGEKKSLSEVGFEPTPSERTRTARLTYSVGKFNLESGALDRSAILTRFPFCATYHNYNHQATQAWVSLI